MLLTSRCSGNIHSEYFFEESPNDGCFNHLDYGPFSVRADTRTCKLEFRSPYEHFLIGLPPNRGTAYTPWVLATGTCIRNQIVAVRVEIRDIEFQVVL